MAQQIAKKTNHVFGKTIVLIGQDTDGVNYWLEAPKWDCGWYWGFGYIETYTNNRNPHLSKDIQSHSHFSGFVGSQEKYNHEKGVWQKGEYLHTLTDNKDFAALTLNPSDSWKLAELFKRFYLLQDLAQYYHTGGAHLTTISEGETANDKVKNLDRWRDINEKEIPPVMAAIMNLLMPEGAEPFIVYPTTI